MLSIHPTHQYPLAINTHIRINFPSSAFEGNAEIWFLLSRHIREGDEPPLYISLHVFQGDGGSTSFVQPEYLTVRVGIECLVEQRSDHTYPYQQGVYQESIHYLVCCQF